MERPQATRSRFSKTSHTDMSNAADLITTLVVGREIRIRLGTLVSNPAKQGTLQLRATHWVPNDGGPDVFGAAELGAATPTGLGAGREPEQTAPAITVSAPAIQPEPKRAPAVRTRTHSRRSALVIGVATLALTSVAVLVVVLRPYITVDKHEQPVRAAVAPASSAQPPASQAQALREPDLVNVVPTVYEPNAPALPLAPASGPQAELPVPPQVVAAVPPSRPAVQTPAGEAPGGARPSQSAAHPSKRPDEPASPAVIVDDGPQQKTAVAAAQVPAVQAQPAPAAAPVRPMPPQDASARAKVAPTTPQREQPRGGRLLAITPDNKAAVFTNPKSGLPEQFKVGDQLPSGDTIRTISQKDGRVMTTAKEYSLE